MKKIEVGPFVDFKNFGSEKHPDSQRGTLVCFRDSGRRLCFFNFWTRF